MEPPSSAARIVSSISKLRDHNAVMDSEIVELHVARRGQTFSIGCAPAPNRMALQGRDMDSDNEPSGEGPR